MNYTEKVQDIFTVSDDYCLVHCISADFSVSKGIVERFEELFGLKAQLKEYNSSYRKYWKENNLKFDCIKTGRVINLVTKEISYYRPTYDSLRGSLELLKKTCIDWEITKLAMPMIGSGLDRLKWEKVSAMITEIFHDTDVEILVCIRP